MAISTNKIALERSSANQIVTSNRINYIKSCIMYHLGISACFSVFLINLKWGKLILGFRLRIIQSWWHHMIMEGSYSLPNMLYYQTLETLLNSFHLINEINSHNFVLHTQTGIMKGSKYDDFISSDFISTNHAFSMQLGT